MRYTRIAIFVFVLLILSLGFHFIAYPKFSFYSVSDSLFVVGIIFFFPALVIQIGSYKVFYGFQYAVRGLFSLDFKRRHRNFSDYLIDKGDSFKTKLYAEVLLSSSVVIVAAIILGLLWDRSL
jgi:hypothetical protein